MKKKVEWFIEILCDFTSLLHWKINIHASVENVTKVLFQSATPFEHIKLNAFACTLEWIQFLHRFADIFNTFTGVIILSIYNICRSVLCAPADYTQHTQCIYGITPLLSHHKWNVQAQKN